jgi:hypothetical protein
MVIGPGGQEHSEASPGRCTVAECGDKVKFMFKIRAPPFIHFLTSRGHYLPQRKANGDFQDWLDTRIIFALFVSLALIHSAMAAR